MREISEQRRATAAEAPADDARASMRIVFATVFLDLVGFGILIPIQPFFAEHFGARPATVTLLSASFSLVQFLLAPFFGRLSDRIGRRPVMLGTIAANAAGYAMFAAAQNLPMLFAARMLCGLGSANIGTAQAIVADLTTPETRAKGMGMIGAAFGLGFILGPAIGGFFSQFGLATPGIAAAAFSTINFVSAYLRLPETRHASAMAREASASAPPSARRATLGLSLRSLSEALERTNVPPLLWIYLVNTTAFSLMETVLGLTIERTFTTTTAAEAATFGHFRQAALLTASFLIVVGLTAAVVQGALIGPLVRRFGEKRLVQTGTFITASSIALLPFAADLGSYAVFVAVGPIIAGGVGLSNPSLPSLLSKTVGRDAHGTILGVGQSLAALGRVLGPSMAGVLFELNPRAPFLLGASLMLTCTAATLALQSTD